MPNEAADMTSEEMLKDLSQMLVVAIRDEAHGSTRDATKALRDLIDERIAARFVAVPRETKCGDRGKCVLSRGHAGWHRDCCDSYWETLAAIPSAPECGEPLESPPSRSRDASRGLDSCACGDLSASAQVRWQSWLQRGLALAREDGLL